MRSNTGYNGNSSVQHHYVHPYMPPPRPWQSKFVYASSIGTQENV